jgi:hypothetical protein
MGENGLDRHFASHSIWLIAPNAQRNDWSDGSVEGAGWLPVADNEEEETIMMAKGQA